MLTADWVRFKAQAARVNDRCSATATKAFSRSGSRSGVVISNPDQVDHINAIP
jgi:histidinol-phosphate/aromatic aminotransferase/cobyric acid decarboxylase-like protein